MISNPTGSPTAQSGVRTAQSPVPVRRPRRRSLADLHRILVATISDEEFTLLLPVYWKLMEEHPEFGVPKAFLVALRIVRNSAGRG